ncbi:hypothetical protein PTMSG1_06229 [Pyrenophora teres f. maculata]|nr:hypothetical protein PTMSG1_06229 [Pyrenophora teres f. maculata]
MANPHRGDSPSPLQHHGAHPQCIKPEEHQLHDHDESSTELFQHLPPVPHPSGFLILPAELRTEVYRHLLNETIRQGQTSDISGIYLACRATHKEMEPMIEHVKTILNIKYACDAVKFVQPRDYLYLTPLSELIVRIPTYALYEKNKPLGIGKQLRELFELPLYTVTLQTYKILNGLFILDHDLPTLLSFISMVNRQEHGCLSATTRVKKLILFETATSAPQYRRRIEKMFSRHIWSYVRGQGFGRQGMDMLEPLEAVHTVDGNTGKCWGIDLENSLFEVSLST